MKTKAPHGPDKLQCHVLFFLQGNLSKATIGRIHYCSETAFMSDKVRASTNSPPMSEGAVSIRNSFKGTSRRACRIRNKESSTGEHL